MRREDILVPARFLLTVGNFISAVMCFFTMPTNTAANFTSDTFTTSSYNEAYNSLTAALILSMIAFAIQFIGLIGGWTMFRDKLNADHCLSHFFGGVLSCWYMIDAWKSTSMWFVLSL